MIDLFKRVGSKHIEREVDDELQFHIDLLTEKYFKQDMSLDEARAAALKRFGNMSEVKNECVKISSGNGSLVLLIKVGLVMLFIFGVLMRVFIPITNFRHLADLLMALAVLIRLMMYVRSLTPSTFLPKQDNRLTLNEKREESFRSYDDRTLTPLERVIRDK